MYHFLWVFGLLFLDVAAYIAAVVEYSPSVLPIGVSRAQALSLMEQNLVAYQVGFW
jgi:hypothetical protein